jgi:hypothetical protein
VVPAPVLLSCGNATTPDFTGTATCTHPCGNTTVTFVDVLTAGVCPNNGGQNLTRVWTCTTACGVPATANQSITLSAAPAPPPAQPLNMILPPNVTIPCSNSTLPAETGFPNVTNACNGGVADTTFSDRIVNGTCPQSYSIFRTWTGM